jgi:hypothetical protein
LGVEVRKRLSYTLVALALALVLAATVLAYHFSGSSPPTIIGVLSNVKPVNPGYLNGSRIYLVSGSLQPGNLDGKACLVANVTIHNGYDYQSGYAFVYLQAELLSNAGVIPATNIGPTDLFLTGNSKGVIFSLASNETDTGPIFIAPTHNLNLQDVTGFEVVMTFEGPWPPP